jgi:hypothetical protein
MKNKKLAGGLSVGLVLAFVTALDANATVLAYPAKGQSTAQQEKDKNTCEDWATKQTGVDPAQLLQQQQQAQAQAQAQAQQNQPPSTLGGAGRGAAGGAALGAVGGAIAGNAGKGAAIGAGAGAAAGGVHARRSQNAQQEQVQKQQQSINAQSQQLLAKYEDAEKVCLKGKGYSVQ